MYIVVTNNVKCRDKYQDKLKVDFLEDVYKRQAFTPATAVIIIVFSIAGLFCFVLCLVFEQAIRYKQENDLTI